MFQKSADVVRMVFLIVYQNVKILLISKMDQNRCLKNRLLRLSVCLGLPIIAKIAG